jgi:hypothetical protein
MPTSHNERHVLERESATLLGQLAIYQRELDATTPEENARRERFLWQISMVDGQFIQMSSVALHRHPGMVRETTVTVV